MTGFQPPLDFLKYTGMNFKFKCFLSGRSKQYRFKEQVLINSGLPGASEAIVRRRNKETFFVYLFSGPPPAG